MGLNSPNDSVMKIISLPRWERDWINSHRSINFSGMVQEVTLDLIKKYDPEYYQKNKHYLELKAARRKDNLPVVFS